MTCYALWLCSLIILSCPQNGQFQASKLLGLGRDGGSLPLDPHLDVVCTLLRESKILSVADPGFSRGGGANSPGGRQHTILLTFPKNCMKLKEFGPPGGARIPRAPLRSVTDYGNLVIILSAKIWHIYFIHLFPQTKMCTLLWSYFFIISSIIGTSTVWYVGTCPYIDLT